MRRSLRIASALLLVLAAAAFAGSAFAGGGNSANAPGQQKQDAAPAPSSTPPGQAKKQTSSSNAAQSSTAPGVKPSNTTSHGVTCTTTSTGCDNGSGHSPADASKRYGNGTTAAQIAASRGAPAGTRIYGPGNSQPHKVSTCGHPAHGNGGGVDVHAVKSYSTAACQPQSTPQTQAVQQHAVPQQGVEVQKTVVVQTTVAAQQHPAPASSSGVAAAAAPKPAAGTGAVLGAQATLTTPAAHHGVLGALGSVAGASLPFTGFPVWVAVLIGLALMATGLVLHRRAALGAR